MLSRSISQTRWPIRRLAVGLCLAGLLTGSLWAGKKRFRPARKQASPAIEWNQKNAAHLMRRAGFSASPEELKLLLDQGFETTLDQLLHPESVQDSQVDAVLGLEHSPNHHPFRLGPAGNRRVFLVGYQDLWLYRMALSKRQLLEKMTFFFHDHFATSGETVFQATIKGEEEPLIGIQHDLMRRHALGNFKQFVHEMARDPAMLLWLDNLSNIAANPNENWARELMELFSIGIGNYTETDVQEAARAFTGWSMSFETGQFRFRPDVHDFGEKTFLGISGNLDGDDIIDRIFEQPETARFMARKLWEFFAYPDPDEELVDELGNIFRESGYEIRPLMKAIFEHAEFYSERAFRALVKSPSEMLVNFLRESGLSEFGFYDLIFLDYLDQANQSLFDPPDVAGWPGGRLWLNTSTMLTRFNLFARLIANRSTSFIGDEKDERIFHLPYWVVDAISSYQLITFDDYISHFLERFLQREVPADVRLALETYMQRGPGGVPQPFDLKNADVDVKIRGLIFLILTLPEYQMN